MQINFNPHVPPGYFETHSMEGVSWRSEGPVRARTTEWAIAQIIKKFDRDCREQMAQREDTAPGERVEMRYRLNRVGLLVIRNPWESIPLVMLDPGDLGRR